MTVDRAGEVMGGDGRRDRRGEHREETGDDVGGEWRDGEGLAGS